MKKTTENELFLSQKRFKKLEKEYRKLKQKREQQRKKHRKSRTYNYCSKVFGLFAADIKKSSFVSNNQIEKTINLPEVFSVIHDPENFLRTLYKLNVGDLNKIQKIILDHSKVTKLDLAAESILDFLILEFKKIKKGRFQLQGYLPDEPLANRYVRATGIIKNLNIEDKFLDSEQEKLHRIFKMRGKNLNQSTSLNSKGWKESAIEDFVKHINQCLKDNNKRLTKKAQGELAKYTGEILNNAEDHSGYDEVVITGYLDNSSSTHWCEIAIFNFGKTIAETFRDMPDTSYTHKEIESYIKKHNSFFSLEWTKDNLLTVVSLQGHISSKNLHKDQDRGQGTVDLIEFFQRMHKQCVGQNKSMAEMAILSGSTYIYFDGKYSMKEDLNGRKVIAFNQNNDLHEKPDSKYVKNLKKLSFPGTIISIKFPMKHENTELLVGDQNE